MRTPVYGVRVWRLHYVARAEFQEFALDAIDYRTVCSLSQFSLRTGHTDHRLEVRRFRPRLSRSDFSNRDVVK